MIYFGEIIFDYFGEIWLWLTAQLQAMEYKKAVCLASESSEALVLKLSDMFRGEGVGRVSEEWGSLWEN